jgi:hypothetical protein
MKRNCYFLSIILFAIFLTSCSLDKEIIYGTVVEKQNKNEGAYIFDKVIVFKLSSKKDSICFYRNGEYVGASVVKIE